MFFLAPIAALFASAASAAPGAATDPASPAPVVVPRDPTTGQPIVQRDETGQPVILRDETGQPIVAQDEEGQILIPPEDESGRPDSLLRNGGGGLFGPDEHERLRDALLGGHDWRAQFALVEGYNSNVIQTQDVTNGPVTHHPSPFTGVDASAEWLSWTSIHDQQSLRIQVRGQHYTPLDGFDEPDDGSANGGWNGQFTLGPRTYLQGRLLGTITTVNSARLDDGPLFQIDPSSIQRTYTLEDARLAIVHELSPRWRWVTGADVELSSTIKDQPIELSPTQLIDHHGLDYVTAGVDTALFHDFDEANIGSLTLRYEPTYLAFLVDFDRNPPLFNGHTTVEMGEASVGWFHAFTERFRSSLTVGAIMSSAPPLDTNTQPILSPAIDEALTYLGNYWLVTGSISYSYGSANPRLGFGPSAGAGLTMQGVPFPHGQWRKLSFLLTAAANRSAYEEAPGELSRLSYLAETAEIRYGINNWLGLLGGYDGRYVVFEGAAAYPSLLRHVVFFGVSGYFSSDRTLPTLDTFTSPIKPPG